MLANKWVCITAIQFMLPHKHYSFTASVSKNIKVVLQGSPWCPDSHDEGECHYLLQSQLSLQKIYMRCMNMLKDHLQGCFKAIRCKWCFISEVIFISVRVYLIRWHLNVLVNRFSINEFVHVILIWCPDMSETNIQKAITKQLVHFPHSI